MNSRRLLVVILCIIVLLIIILPIFVSGIGTATHLQISAIEQSTEILDTALASAGWQRDPSKQYFVAAYETDLRSFVPFSLNLLTGQVTEQPASGRVHALPPDFAYTLHGFQHVAYSFPFLVEAAPNVSPEEVLNSADFVVRSKRNKWARIPVSISRSLQVEEHTQS